MEREEEFDSWIQQAVSDHLWHNTVMLRPPGFIPESAFRKMRLYPKKAYPGRNHQEIHESNDQIDYLVSTPHRTYTVAKYDSRGNVDENSAQLTHSDRSLAVVALGSCEE
jgi:hypothetical protein